MSTFIFCGKYSAEALKGMSSTRTSEALKLIKKFDGEVQSMYAMVGQKDLVFIINFPNTNEALKASVALFKLTGISFETSELIPVDKFDKLMSEF